MRGVWIFTSLLSGLYVQNPAPFGGPTLATTVLKITTIIFVYWYSTRNFDYWKKRGIPYVEPVPFLGSMVDLLKKSFQEIEIERYFKLGPIYGQFEGNTPMLTVADPVLLRQILVKDFHCFINRRSVSTGDKIFDSFLPFIQGDDWKRIRSTVSPTFTSVKLKKMMAILEDCSKTLVKNFKAAAEEGKPVDAKNSYGAFTMDIISSSAFSMKIDSLNNPDNKFIQAAKDGFSTKFGYRFILFQLFPFLMRIFRIPIVSSTTTSFFKDVTIQIIKKRKKTGEVRNDFLQLLMATSNEMSPEQKGETKENKQFRSDITSNYDVDENGQQMLKNMSNKRLSIDELVGQCVVFFIAGYDTTGLTLSFVSYLLALHNDVQEKAYQELKEVLLENKGKLTYETIQSMKYLDNIISESLRLYPATARLERVANVDYILGDTGITIPKGMIVHLPNFPIQRDPKYFPDPERFDPDRFIPEERAKRDQYTYFPFGAGPRNCVGIRFALLAMKICLAHVIGTFKIKKCSQTKVPLDFEKGQFRLQPKEIKVCLELRKDCLFK